MSPWPSGRASVSGAEDRGFESLRGCILSEPKGSEGWFRSTDLWVMSPTRFRCATSLCRTLSKVDTPLELASCLTNHRGIPVSEPYRGFFKRTHLHTTLNKSRDERTGTVPYKDQYPRDRTPHTQNGSNLSFPQDSRTWVRNGDCVTDRRHWCSGNIGASQALAPGSIPGWRTLLRPLAGCLSGIIRYYNAGGSIPSRPFG